ncbi:hypothetical protein KRMM14A1259_44940 [Krasilnikovia sp. MM14-A1259]
MAEAKKAADSAKVQADKVTAALAQAADSGAPTAPAELRLDLRFQGTPHKQRESAE